jgi:hypothetical protein
MAKKTSGMKKQVLKHLKKDSKEFKSQLSEDKKLETKLKKGSCDGKR